MARAGRKDRGLYCKRDSAGKVLWYVRLYHEGRDRRFGSFATKTKAREFYEKAKLEQAEGRFFPERYQRGGYAKLAEAIEAHLATFTGRSRRDEERYKKKWLELFPDARLNALTPAALEQARAQLVVGRSIVTVNHYFKFLRRVLNKAVRDGHLTANPVSRIKLFKEPAGQTRFLSVEEEEALCRKLGAPFASWVRLAILTGMRQQEQFSLRWEHVDMERGVLTLPATKSGGVQYVRLNAEAKAVLHSLIPGNKSVWVFPSANPKTHADPRNFYRRHYLPAVKELGLTGVTWHTLRHTFASRLAMAGVTERAIAELLRHSGTALVRRYAHLSPSYLQEAVEKVSAFGKAAPGQAAMPAQSGPAEPDDPSEMLELVPVSGTGPGTGKMGGEELSR
jgi:integrase